jgi:hypothetical protein
MSDVRIQKLIDAGQPPAVASALVQDASVSADVAANIKKLMSAGLSFDAAAIMVHNFQKAGGYSVRDEDDGDSPKRRESATHGAAEDATPAPMTYYAPDASNADAPVRDTPQWTAEVERLMRERGMSRRGAEAALAARETRKRDLEITKAYRAERDAKIAKGAPTW